MVIFQTSREGSELFSDVVPVPRAVEFKMATGCKFLSLAASSNEARRHLVNACFNPCDLIGFERTMRDSVKNLLNILK